MLLRRVEPTQTLALDLRQGEVDPDAVTRLYGSLWSLLHRGNWQTWLRGPGQLSFEAHATHQGVRYYVTVPVSQCATVRRQMQLTFPGVAVGEVADPLKTWVPTPSAELAGALLVPRREPSYPLQWDYSPTAYLRGALVLNEGEEVWLQVVARPRVRDPGRGSRSNGGAVAAIDFVNQSLGMFVGSGQDRPAAPKSKSSPTSSGQIDYMSLDRRHMLAAAQKGNGGHLWQTVIRVLAATPEGRSGRAHHLRKAALSPFCWDAGPNSLRSRRAWFSASLLQRMQERWLPGWWTKCLLSPAELGALAQVVPPPTEAQSGARVLVVEEDLS